MEEDLSQGDLFKQHEEEEKKSEADKEQKIAAERERLLNQIKGGQQLSTLQSRVAFILSQNPETRNSDVTLQLQYWQTFQRHMLKGGMVELSDLYDLQRLTNLKRARAKIQNDLKLFLPTDQRVSRYRKQLSETFRKAYTPPESTAPALFVYADESGKKQDHLVVGSVWMLASGEYFRFLQEAQAWKNENNVDYELHSADLGRSRLTKYKAFIEEFVLQQGIFGFKAVTIANSGFRDEGRVIADLYYWLLRRGIEHESETNRAPLPRRIAFTKDAEEQGYDERVLAHIDSQLSRDAKTVFDNRLFYDLEEPLSSKNEILLQIADLFTWSVNRRLNVLPNKTGALSWKDEFAEWFLKQVQFSLDASESLKDRAVKLSLQSPTIKQTSTRYFKTPEAELKKLEKSEKATHDE